MFQNVKGCNDIIRARELLYKTDIGKLSQRDKASSEG